MEHDDRRERGTRIRRAVLGDEHVDRSIERLTAIDAPFQEYIAGAAWADVWGRDGIDLPTRSLITVALLAAGGHEEELAMHLRATRRTGATVEQLTEVLLHVAVYAGVPAANTAFAVMKRVLDDTGSPDAGPQDTEQPQGDEQ